MNVTEGDIMKNSIIHTLNSFENEKHTFVLWDLLRKKIKPPPMLLIPFLPSVGSVALVGPPDTGKSQLARQLCLAVASDKKTFLSYKLNQKNKGAIYVSTEDEIENVKYLFSKQLLGYGIQREFSKGIKVVFGDTLEPNFYVSHLEALLSYKPVDIVVIDSFSDAFIGSDYNSSNEMRNTIKLYDKLAKKYKCLILFVHHINKSGYDKNPHQVQVMGGSGFIQKVRAVFDLRNHTDPNLRFLTVVKGNQIPAKYKKDSLILEFDEDNFLFHNTGDKIAKDEISNTQDRKREIDWLKIFDGSDDLKRKEMIIKLENNYGFSQPTCDRYLNDAVKDESLIRKKHGIYSINDGN